jgi:general secretion pathway protein F/type IV pilus assembly protein PilC
MIFKYKAFSFKGKKVIGYIASDSFDDAKIALKKEDLVVMAIAPLKLKKNIMNKRELLYFTEEMHKLLKASLPLYEALLAMEEKYRNTKIHPLILDICDKVKKGVTFSEALASHPTSFDIIYCSIIANAERSANLDKALEEIASFISKRLTLKKQVMSALLYPSILVAFSAVIVAALIFFIIPSLFELFEGRQLHPMTQFVLGVSHFAINAKAEIALVLLFFKIATLAAFTIRPIKIRVKKYLMNFILVRPFFLKAALIRFCRSFATLLKGGVPYETALDLATSVMAYPLLEADMQKAKKAVLEGKKLSDQLKISRHIPPLFSRMLSIGEESGNEAAMLQHLAIIYEDELEKNLTRFTTILQPVILLIMGLFVGLLVLSILLPLTDVSSF